uniref:Inner membrane protein of type IV secretion of T-DNA complex, VirB6 n=1 Tax=Acetobacter pasteurianus TaxID=438 RepID=I3W071_ACEPA|nr:type IV secretion system protein [Acetobacter pasteurianus]AFK88998.1 Inner membrane protein of type IV secretion of T-DNA complex, VirB6 [Acetobacter pasteurianus]
MSLANALTPIGSFIIKFDTEINTAQLTAVSGLVAIMNRPLLAAAIIYLAIEGWKVAAGDLQRINSLTFTFAKFLVIFYLATDLTNFNQWIVGYWEHGFTEAITSAVTANDNQMTSINGVAGAIDQLWNDMWLRVAHIMKNAAWTDVASRGMALLTAAIGSFGLILIAGVYLIARFLFAIVVVLGPVCIGCAMFPTTRPIFERWIGKGVSMIVLQVAAVITMQIVLIGAADWAHDNSPLATGGVGGMLENELSFAVWICLGAFAIYSLPTLAYSIGTGIAVSFAPIVASALAAATGLMALKNGGPVEFLEGAGGGEGGNDGSSGGGGDYSLDLSQARLESAATNSMLTGSDTGLLGGSNGYLPAPPPALPPPPRRLPSPE